MMFDDTDYARGLIIPALQSLVTGIFTLCALLPVCLVFGWPAAYAITATGIAGLAAWFFFRAWWARLIQAEAGQYPTAVDLAQQQPLEPAEPQTVKVIVEEHQGRDTAIIDLPATPSQLALLARGIEQGQSLSLGAWAGPGNVFTRAQWERLRSELIRRGLAAWVNPHAYNQGFALTTVGVHVLKRIQAPTPQADDRLHN